MMPLRRAVLLLLAQGAATTQALSLLSRRDVLLSLGAATTQALSVRTSSPLASAWDRGAGAAELRRVVAAAPGAASEARAAASSTARWRGLWVARIEHFDKVAFTGLRVRPHYDIGADGAIVSDVHIAIGPLKGWASASGFMRPTDDGVVDLVFDDFWIAGDAPAPRAAPADADASAVDALIRGVGRAAFFEGLARFPVDYFDEKAGLVAFRFTPFDSEIVAQRAPDGDRPRRCDGV